MREEFAESHTDIEICVRAMAAVVNIYTVVSH